MICLTYFSSIIPEYGINQSDYLVVIVLKNSKFMHVLYIYALMVELDKEYLNFLELNKKDPYTNTKYYYRLL